MKKSKNSSELLKMLSGATNVSPSARSGSSPKLPSGGDIGRSSLALSADPKAINFGKESKAAQGATSAKSSSGVLNTFVSSALKSSAGGSLGSLFGASGFGALGSLVSGLTTLFGGGKSETTALPAFSLPGSQIQTMAVRTTSTETNLDARTQPTATYGKLPDTAVSAQHYTDQSAQIAQAVKTALLQSHSLGDVINEL